MISRRRFLAAAAAGAVAAPAALRGSAAWAGDVPTPDAYRWPSTRTWETFAGQLRAQGSRLLSGEAMTPPWDALAGYSPSDLEAIPEELWAQLRNPFLLMGYPGATQATGLYRLYDATPSRYAVRATSTRHVIQAMDFARRQRVRLVVKGAGNDWYGRSVGPAKSLTLWNLHLRGKSGDPVYHRTFRPQGAPSSRPAHDALETYAGHAFVEAYAVAIAQGRFFQGGLCTPVGACGGYTLGGGMGLLSKRHGSGAGNLIQAECVLVDGSVVIANEYQHADVFWALRGGAGGNIGVVTRMWYRLHEPPKLAARYWFLVQSSWEAFPELLETFIAKVYPRMMTPEWGSGGGPMTVTNAQGETVPAFSFGFEAFSDTGDRADLARSVRDVHQPILDLVERRPKDYQIVRIGNNGTASTTWYFPRPYVVAFDDYLAEPQSPSSQSEPDYWGKAYTAGPKAVAGERPQHWWRANLDGASAYRYASVSHGIPIGVIQSVAARGRLVSALMAATRMGVRTKATLGISFDINKGLYGAPAHVLDREAQTSTNPAYERNTCLFTIDAYPPSGDLNFPVEGWRVDSTLAQEARALVYAAYDELKRATPGGGSYINEGDPFNRDPELFWGSNYPRLLKLKHRYDPTGLLRMECGVGTFPGDPPFSVAGD